MASVWRDPSVGREVALSAEQLRAWLTHASYHARLAVSIAALAPKLRQANILALRWDTSTRRSSGSRSPSTRRRRALASRSSSPSARSYSVSSPTRADVSTRADATVRSSSSTAAAGSPACGTRCRPRRPHAGLPYGLRARDGVTLHSLRHTAATMLAELDVAEPKRQQVMGHSSIPTTQRYTHLRPLHLFEPVE
jgi:integrase